MDRGGGSVVCRGKMFLRWMRIPSNNTLRITHFPFTSPVMRIHALQPGDKNAVEDVKRTLEMAKMAALRHQLLHTDFLTPPILKESKLALEKLADIKSIAQGGYPQAERCRLSVGHPEAFTIDPDIVAALSITGNFGFQPCSHGDFLGAILGTGISREKFGGIILQGEKGAHLLVVPELVDFLTSSLDKVGNVSVSCKRIRSRAKAFKTVEKSLEVDSIASAKFKISRSKMVGVIRSGDVRINWTTILKRNTRIKTDDIVSVTGMGSLKIGEITTTKRGKFAVELIRYL